MDIQPESLNAMTIVLLILYVLVRDIVTPLIKKLTGQDNGREIRECLRRLTDIAEAQNKKIKDLHQWHAPDNTGDQPWRGGRILTKLEEIGGKLDSIRRAG